MAARDIIAIGASAGGYEAISRLTARFPPDLPATVLITLHVSRASRGLLPSILDRCGPLPAGFATDGERVTRGRIYIAPPDYHLALDDGRIFLSHGPRENLQRPCINVMFRSAAQTYGQRVSGVLLTGLLDDGAAGLWEIQQHGGATIVQDPAEAPYPDMPENAIRGLNVQYIVGVDEMASLLTRLAMTHSEDARQNPEQALPENSAQTCPECGGAITSFRLGHMHEYRCHTGHRFGLHSLIAQKSSSVEHALNAALAQSEELSVLLEIALAQANPERAPEIRNELEQRKVEQESLRNLTRNRSSLIEI